VRRDERDPLILNGQVPPADSVALLGMLARAQRRLFAASRGGGPDAEALAEAGRDVDSCWLTVRRDQRRLDMRGEQETADEMIARHYAGGARECPACGQPARLAGGAWRHDIAYHRQACQGEGRNA
jgi:IS5 family transposase